MQLRAIQRIVGILLVLFSVTMLPPIVVAWITGEQTVRMFLAAFMITLFSGVILWLPARAFIKELRLRDGFMIVAMFWVVLGVFGAFPFILDSHLPYIDAIFESVSGLTTTGSTVFTHIDDMPRSILYYRQQLQWLGGMGIIVLAVAILPMLGIGGMQLYRAETPGPMKDNKLTPRITETAKALWYIYLGLTIACATAYWLAGMPVFDAITNSFSTVSLGGLSTHDTSFAYFDNVFIEVAAIIFMLLSGVNFAIHFIAWRNISLNPYIRDPEFRAYVLIVGVSAMITTVYLYASGTFASAGSALRYGIFQTVSFGTTTGFTTAAYPSWPAFVPALLLVISFIGGCAASTSGGLKVIRVLLLWKQGMREIKRLIHPSGQFSIKIGEKSLPGPVVHAIWGFFMLYMVCFTVMSLLLAATGLDLVTSFSAVAACLNNTGTGLGAVGSNFATINTTAKSILCVAMLLGRLEIFTLLVLFTPAFWKK